jgi:uncharacterized protein (DUF1330 family)
MASAYPSPTSRVIEHADVARDRHGVTPTEEPQCPPTPSPTSAPSTSARRSWSTSTASTRRSSRSGGFIIHGATPEVLEDAFPGVLVVIEFPDREAANAWYASPAYQAILPLRREHSDGTAFIVDGVKPGHRAPDAPKQV